MHETCRDMSRREHWTNDGQGLSTYQRAQLGCLQRIADALEVLGRPHSMLIDEVERLRADNARLVGELTKYVTEPRKPARRKKEATV